jgi:hypothetical protein
MHNLLSLWDDVCRPFVMLQGEVRALSMVFHPARTNNAARKPLFGFGRHICRPPAVWG